MIAISPLLPRAVLALIGMIAFLAVLPGQQQSDHSDAAVVGTVKSISGNAILVQDGGRSEDRLTA
jgi:hypothetical protein